MRTSNTWVRIEDEIHLAEQSDIDQRIEKLIRSDLNDRALEGMTEKRRLRSACVHRGSPTAQIQ